MSKRKNQPEKPIIQTEKAIPVTPSGSPNPRWWLLGAALLIFIATQMAYNGASDNNYVDWDDQLYVTENPMVLQHGKKGAPPVWSTPIALNYHPLTMETMVWNAKNAPTKDGIPAPRPFITTNVFLHSLNGILVLLLVWLLTRGNLFVSLFTALIFALHPMHVESVAWISERKDVLYVFFYLLSACAYLRFSDTRTGYWWLAAFGLFILSCLSKAMAVSLVPLLFLFDWWRDRSLLSARVWIDKIPFMAAALFFGLVAVDIQGGGNFHGMLSGIEGVKTATSANANFEILAKLQVATYGMSQYIIRFFAPFQLSAFYPFPSEFINKTALPAAYPASLLGFLAISGIAYWSKKWTKIVLFGFLFFFFTVVLVSQFFTVGLVIMADRYTYLPYIGIAIAVLLGIYHLGVQHKTIMTAGWGVLTLACIGLLLKTQAQVEVWQNTDTLWTSALEQYPNDGQILANLGNYYGKSGQIDKAARCFEQAIEQNIQNASVYEGLGNVYGARGDHQKAADMFTHAIDIDPEKGNFYFNRGTAYLNIDPVKSIVDFTKALSLMPPAASASTYSKRALAHFKTKNFQSAIADYSSAIQAGSNSASDYFDRGVSKLNLNDKAGATVDIKQSLKIDPNFVPAKNALLQLQ